MIAPHVIEEARALRARLLAQAEKDVVPFLVALRDVEDPLPAA